MGKRCPSLLLFHAYAQQLLLDGTTAALQSQLSLDGARTCRLEARLRITMQACKKSMSHVKKLFSREQAQWHQQKTSSEGAAADQPAPCTYPCVKHSQPTFALQNTTPIRVPPTLDLAPYCSKEALPSNRRYELIAVANHMGSRGSGHCTANCRSAVDGRWYSCNDSTVQCSRYQEKPSQLAYLLFYRHVE